MSGKRDIVDDGVWRVYLEIRNVLPENDGVTLSEENQDWRTDVKR